MGVNEEIIEALEQQFLTHTAQWVKALRKRMGVTQVQLAELISASVESVSRWELGKIQPYALNLLRLMALATPQERDALVDRASCTLNDVMFFEIEGGLAAAMCEACGLPIRVRDFTTHGWPAPPKVQQHGDPYAVRRCPVCPTSRLPTPTP